MFKINCSVQDLRLMWLAKKTGKPRIFKRLDGKWYCFAAIKNLSLARIGNSPKDAYNNWLRAWKEMNSKETKRRNNHG